MFLRGPGLLFAGVALFKLFQRLGKFIGDAFTSISGLNAQSGKQAQIQEKIFSYLSGQPQLMEAIRNKTVTMGDAHKFILEQIQKETLALKNQELVARGLATSLRRTGVRIGEGAGKSGEGKLLHSRGHVPNFFSKERLRNGRKLCKKIRSHRECKSKIF